MGVWKDKAKNYWRYSFKHHNQRYTGSGYPTKAEARSAREEHRKAILQTPLSETTATAFSVIANTYLDWSQKRHAKKTYDYKRSVYREFLAFHGDLDIHAITPQHLHLYLATRPTNHNYNIHRKELSALFNFAIKQLMVISVSPCWSLQPMPIEPARKYVPSFEEVTRLVLAANATERPLLLVLLHTLARIDEILRLRWQDVSFEQRTLNLWTRKRKGGNLESRSIGINDDLYDVLWQLWSRRTQDEWVFCNPKTGTRYQRRKTLMRKLCRRAGVPHYGFHTLRHFASSYLHDKAKVPTGVIGQILGHKSRRTTEIYLHSIDSASIEAVKKLEGIFPAKQEVTDEQIG